MTGTGCCGGGSGVHTLRYRQLSSCGNSGAEPGGRMTAPWGQPGPNAVASRGTDQCSIGCGAFQRKSPIGGAAYGIPTNARVAPAIFPCTGPSRVWISVPDCPLTVGVRVGALVGVSVAVAVGVLVGTVGVAVTVRVGVFVGVLVGVFDPLSLLPPQPNSPAASVAVASKVKVATRAVGSGKQWLVKRWRMRRSSTVPFWTPARLGSGHKIQWPRRNQGRLS
jgi:hypothetical protein